MPDLDSYAIGGSNNAIGPLILGKAKNRERNFNELIIQPNKIDSGKSNNSAFIKINKMSFKRGKR